MASVSVIIPVFNEEEHIESTLESILSQNVPGVEVIVVNSESTDRTVELASRYPVAILQAPRGKLKARAIGIAGASGEVIVAADGDSIYPAGWLHKLTRHFSDPQVIAVSGPRLYFDRTELNIALYAYYFLLPRPNLMLGGNSAFRRDAFYQVGGFQHVDEYNANSVQQEEEHAFGDRLASLGRYVYDREAVCYTSGRRWCLTCKHQVERQRGERF